MTYDASLSGFWSFRGLYEMEQNDLTAAEKSLDEAFSRDDWELGDFDHFLDEYFSLLFRLGRWEKILKAEESVAFQRGERAEILLAAGWADYFLGKGEKAFSRGRKGVDFYPGDWRFHPLLIAAGSDDWIPSLIHYWGKDDEVMNEIFIRLYRLQCLPDSLADWYINDGKEPGAFLTLTERIKSASGRNGSYLTDYLQTWQTADLYSLMSLADLGGESDRIMLNRYILDFPGELLYDGDGDTFPEIKLTEKKILMSDRNRDGRWDTQIALGRGGMPESWQSYDNKGTSSQMIHFFEWPYVREVVRSSNDTTQNLDYLYPRFSLKGEGLLPENTIEDVMAPLVLELADWIGTADLKIPFHVLSKNCREIKERKEGILTRKYYLTDGEVVGIEEDTDHMGWFNRQVLLDKGEITAARRDLNGDGTFDVFEYYENGNWQGYAVNLNGEGQSDYFEDWSFIPLKIWDYDGDSFMDGLMAGPYGEETVTVIPHRDDPRDVGDYIDWERRFEAQWYR